MKKKKIVYRILSFMFCCMFLLFAGCGADSPGGGGGSSDDNVKVLDGTKVLSRPSGYSFSDAVGEYSEHYYNLYALNILDKLYSVYEDGTSFDNVINPKEDLIAEGYMPLQGENTFGKFQKKQEYYLRDSIRYSITKVEDVMNTAGTVASQRIYWDLENSWNWKIKDNNSLYFNIASKTAPTLFSDYSQTDNSAVTSNGNNWLDNFEKDFIYSSYPNFSSSYTGNAVPKQDVSPLYPEGIVNYYESPYYETVVEGNAASTAKNFYQDALEYAIYMFVLGYDYHMYDSNGNLVEGQENAVDAPYFNFNITYGTDGYVSGITVDGWGNAVPIVDALQLAKDRYNEIGGYVGVVEKNLQQITRFILEKVIGENSSDVVNVHRTAVLANGSATTKPEADLIFNRNYAAIVNNIVRYSCEQAPIGYTLDEDGNPQILSLSNGFSASMITEYKSNYFFANYDVLADGVYINDDKEIFQNIDAAEYQSLVIYPCEELLGKSLGDMWLDFEYNDCADPTKVMLDELVINVGFRYFDYNKKEIVVDKQQQMKIKRGKNGELRDENGEDISDETLFMISEDEDDAPDGTLIIEPDSVKFSEFNNEIGGGILDPFANSSIIPPVIPGFPELELPFKASKYLSGTNNARKYYKLNNSTTAGQYGTLNEEMFKGTEGCSFIEVYFDIVKDPSRSGVCYDFKVCFRNISEHEDPNAEPDIGDDFDDEDF